MNPAPPEADAIRVGTSGDYAPFSLSDGGLGTPSGFSIALAEAWARQTGRGIEWVAFRWSELRDDLEAGRFDLVLSGVTVRPDRSVAGRFSLPLTTSGAVVLVESDHLARSAADLRRPGLRVAVNAGGHLERTTRSLLPTAWIEPVAENVRVLGRLGRDGIEAVVTDTVEAPHWQARRPGLRVIGPLTIDLKAAWFPIGAEGEARRFDRWLVEIERTGELARLRVDFGLPAARTAMPVAALLASLDERLSLMIPVGRAKQVLDRPIEDPAREARVVAAAIRAIEAEAVRRGLRTPTEGVVRDLYGAQIAAAKWIQSQRTAGNGSRHDDAALHDARIALEERLRPALLYLGDRIARLLVAAVENDDEAPTFEEVRRALARHALPEPQLRALHDALRAVLES